MTTKTALISVYHKDGIDDFARELIKLGFTIYASGGTAWHLSTAGIQVLDVSTLVGGDAILGHRVVTLSRQVHAGLLARNIQVDIEELAKLGIPHIDLVCVDLYPIEKEIAKPDSTLESVIEQTDIGGPTMIRSGAKGQRIVICVPEDRQKVIDWLKAGQPDQTFVEWLAAKGEFTISKYCMASARYRSGGKYYGIFGEKIADCKYGENAWQTPAALFSSGTDDPLALDKFEVIEGTPPSYNNWCDIDRLLQTLTHIVSGYHKNSFTVGDTMGNIAIGAKHGNVCGAHAYPGQKCPRNSLILMMRGDPLAIFGGLVMTNFIIDNECAGELTGKMLDGIIAPDFTHGAINKLRRKGDKCRFIRNEALADLTENSLDQAPRFRYVRGGFLKQPNYDFVLNLYSDEIKQYGLKASSDEKIDLILAWAIGSTSNSNTITLVKNNMLIGNGVGQQDRVGAAKLAIERTVRSRHETRGAVAYGDSFFPFSDGVQTLIEAGVSAILTSSGSVRDKEVIDVCIQQNITLYMIPDSIGRGFFGH